LRTGILTLGTRGSALALAQARSVAAMLREAWPGLDVRLEVIRTGGDRVTDRSLAAFGQKGVFVRELEEALLDGRIRAAVHSLKDLPSTLGAAFVLAAVPPREDPRDCLVSRCGQSLKELPAGAVIGTGSPRRAAQILALRSDLVVRDIRGNVDTRLEKLRRGEYDAVILAAAGLRRLGLDGVITRHLEPEEMTGAVGQGALGIETRAHDAEAAEILRAVEDAPTRAAVEAERALARTLNADCQTPLGALAVCCGDRLTLTAALAAPDGSRVIRVREEGSPDEPQGAGERAARLILEQGASALLDHREQDDAQHQS